MNPAVLLVAEDDPIDALLFERALRRSGCAFKLMRVANGEELIAYIEGSGAYADRANYPPARIVLLDLKMPRKDGFAVLRWRQKRPHACRVPVVVLTSSCLDRDVEQAYELGANSYVIKPSAPGRLEAMVRSLHEWWIEFNTTPARAPA
jgi:CheY-like chemotaxis protein